MSKKRNKVNPVKSKQVYDWQDKTEMRSATSMIRGLYNINKHGRKKELSPREQSHKIRKSLQKVEKRIEACKAYLGTPKDLRLPSNLDGHNDALEKLRRLEHVKNEKINNLTRLARLDASNKLRESARQKTLREMERGKFPPQDDPLIPLVIRKKIKKAGKPAQLENVFTKVTPVSQQQSMGNPFKR